MLVQWMKTIGEKIPEPIGKLASSLPYSLRLGPAYLTMQREIRQFSGFSILQQQDWIFNHIKGVVNWASLNHSFYAEFYKKESFDASLLNIYSDIQNIPIVTRGDLQMVPLELRATHIKGRHLTNTGGSSGQPLVFYLDSQAFAREWAHMHYIWQQLGYKTTDLKLVFRGKNLGERPLVYNAVHNEYVVNAYCQHDQVCDALWKKMKSNRIRFLHGYPSAIFDFITYCLENRSDVIDELRKNLKGILYASEYPAPIYREPVEECLGVKSMSWYGHSEFSVLAYEVEKYIYAPLHTYGYAEAIPSEEGHRLICTGYYNHVSPFIRYDTGDLIDPIENDGVLKTFRIVKGRLGDFICDTDGKRISLTALIYGRHHPIFSKVKFLQIAQQEAGVAVIILTRREHNTFREDIVNSLMDLSNVKIKFDIIFVNEPFRTKAGKVNLLVPFEQVMLKPQQGPFERDSLQN